jgi:hypothetical protein
MNDLGGYAPQLDFAIGAALGQSPLLPQTCVGATTGTANPDGQCVLGGRTTRSGACDATPIFVQNMVPYTTGAVSGVRYDLLRNLKSYTRLNQSALLQNLQRTSR